MPAVPELYILLSLIPHINMLYPQLEDSLNHLGHVPIPEPDTTAERNGILLALLRHVPATKPLCCPGVGMGRI